LKIRGNMKIRIKVEKAIDRRRKAVNLLIVNIVLGIGKGGFGAHTPDRYYPISVVQSLHYIEILHLKKQPHG
jgi:hypothetical protein